MLLDNRRRPRVVRTLSFFLRDGLKPTIRTHQGIADDAQGLTVGRARLRFRRGWREGLPAFGAFRRGFFGSERESDETATFTQLSSPAELRGTDVGHRHPLGHG